MSVTGTSGTGTMPAEVLASVNPKAKSTSTMEAAENRFLMLLTTQLKNQDPLNPLDNAQMTSQMAQISTVNGIEKLNATMEKLMSNSSDAQAMQAAALLGHQVMVAGNGMTMGAEGVGIGGIELPQPVDKATVAIRDANGLTMRTIELGALPEGLKSFGWDGRNNAGQPVAQGRYSFSVTAEQGGKSVTATSYELAPVTGVLRDKSGLMLEVGQLGNFGINEIRQIY